MPDPNLPELPGYEILSELGSGGMATVYLAVQKSLERKVAIKVLRTDHDDDPEKTERRFLREGRTLAKLTHKNICGIYDIAKIGRTAYIAMEFLDGGTLVDRLKHGVTVAEAIASVVQVASALGEAHAQGIVHRDLKPSNVMMRAGKVPVLTDFGIARELTANQTKITAENMIVGTPAYMSPEQVTGGEVDGRSDVYSLGIMFFELLTGQVPYRGDTPIAVCMQHLTAALPKLPPNLAELQPILDRLLAKNADERYASMAEFTASLRNACVASSELRNVMRFSPDQPWSEQLRGLGFTFDTLKDADVRAAIEAQRREERARTGSQKAVSASQAGRQADSAAQQYAPAPVKKGMPAWLMAVIGVVLLGIGGVSVYLMQQRGPSDLELAALKSYVVEFDAMIKAGSLYGTDKENAAYYLGQMQKIDAQDPRTVDAQKRLWDDTVARARSAAQEGKAEGLQDLINASAQFFPEADVANLANELSQTLESVASSKRAKDVIASLNAKLDKKDLIFDTVKEEFLNMRSLLPANNKDRMAIEAKVEARYAGRAALRMESDLNSAELFAAEWVELFPDSKNAKAMQAQIQVEFDKQGFTARLASIEELLKTEDLGVSTVNTFFDQATRLRALPQAASKQNEIQNLQQRLMLQLIDAIKRESGRNLAQAESLIKAGLAGVPNDPRLLELSKALQAKRVEQEALENSGRVAINAVPWGKVQSIRSGDGKSIPLPKDTQTPIVIALPRGNYTIEVQGPTGSQVKQPAIINAKSLAEVRFDLRTVREEDVLKEAGY
jgi:tRNA A-37 threonylcarbamoyl transferase component Bud32